LREALRSRGWVEKFENMNQLPSVKKQSKNAKKKNNPSNGNNNDLTVDDDRDVDDCNDDNDDTEEIEEEDKIKPWEENNGYYGILSRLVKNYNSTFIWTVRAGNVDYSYMNKDQMFNHFNKNGAFTTKVTKYICYIRENAVFKFILTHLDRSLLKFEKSILV
jgi:hypothetical protein